MKILVACEYSGRVRQAFTEKGHSAISCDLLPTEQVGQHFQGNVLEIIDMHWDMIIAFPPCTYLSKAGVRWLHSRPERWGKLDTAAYFFKAILDADCNKICVENPIMHRYALERVGKKYDQIVHPWMFGHTYTKATCLWLKGLPILKASDCVKEETFLLPKKKRQMIKFGTTDPKKRSLTPQGLADAMADQWG